MDVMIRHSSETHLKRKIITGNREEMGLFGLSLSGFEVWSKALDEEFWIDQRRNKISRPLAVST